MAKFCIHCGAPLNETDLFCSNCGTRIAPAEAPEQPASAETIPEESVTEAPATPDIPEVPDAPEVPYAQPVFRSQSAPSDEAEPAPAPQQSYRPYPQDGYQQSTYPGSAQPYPQSTQPYPQNGYPQNAYPQNSYQQPYPAQQPKKKHTGLIIGLIIGAVVFIGLIVGMILLFLGLARSSGGGGTDATINGNGGGSGSGTVTAYSQPEDVAGAYFEAMEGVMTGSGTVNDLIDLSYEVHYIKPAYKSEIEETLTESFGEFSLGNFASLIGDDFSISYRIDDVITMSVSDREDFIEENDLSEYCETSAIEEMCRVKAVMAMEGSFFNETLDDGEDYEMVCIKADGKWYLAFSSIE